MTPKNIWRWMVERLHGVLENIIATLILAGAAYVIGAVSGLLPRLTLPGPIPVPLLGAVLVLLCGLIVALLIMIIRRSRKKADPIRMIKLQQLARPVDLERLGLSQYIKPDPLLVDNTHRFLLIHQKYLIEGYDGTLVLRYRGKNLAKRTSRFFRDSVAGDSAADVSLMAIQVRDRITDIPLKLKLLKDEPYEKLIEVYFCQPLNFGDVFDIEFSCRWPGTFTRQDDYVFYPMHYYRRGVDKLVCELVLNAAPSYIEGLRFNGTQLELETTQPKMLNIGGKCIITWEIENPKYIYLMQYGRKDI